MIRRNPDFLPGGNSKLSWSAWAPPNIGNRKSLHSLTWLVDKLESVWPNWAQEYFWGHWNPDLFHRAWASGCVCEWCHHPCRGSPLLLTPSLLLLFMLSMLLLLFVADVAAVTQLLVVGPLLPEQLSKLIWPPDCTPSPRGTACACACVWFENSHDDSKISWKEQNEELSWMFSGHWCLFNHQFSLKKNNNNKLWKQNILHYYHVFIAAEVLYNIKCRFLSK